MFESHGFERTRRLGKHRWVVTKVVSAASRVSAWMQMVQNLAQTLASEIADGRRPPGSALPSTRALAAQLGCAPGTVSRVYGELRRAGLIAARDRARARVAAGGSSRARWWLAGGTRVRLAGSDDPALDALLRAAGDAVELVSGPRGSVYGLEAMARGRADAAVVHLLHAEAGRYNDPYVRHLLPGEAIVLVHLWQREVGLVVPRGNPLGVRGVADLAGRRVAWRTRGSGSRLLLERLLSEAGVEAAPESGEPADSHFAVAAAVATGAADAGLAVRAVARACDLDFVGVTVEPFELAVREKDLDDAAGLLARLHDPAFAERVAALGGYDMTQSGAHRRAE
jgi:molybdate-binding protein